MIFIYFKKEEYITVASYHRSFYFKGLIKVRKVEFIIMLFFWQGLNEDAKRYLKIVVGSNSPFLNLQFININ